MAALALLFVAGAQAVHGEGFQLDGDVRASTTTSVGGSTQSVDWDTLFDASGNEKPLPAGFTDSGFDKDFNNSGSTFLTNDTSTFATGSKDTLPISGWQCNFDNNVNSKIDVMNSYAARYVDLNGAGTADDDEILYFALERNTNTGDANVAFWFLQQDVDCDPAGAPGTFTGAHQDGDLLIVSAFSGGGKVSTIDVYRWNGGANGSLGTTPLAHGVDCRDPATGSTDKACAAANTADIATTWQTANFKDGVGTKLRVAEFYEGGVNLTDSGLGGKCFNTFLGDTRSSTSLTATLFDYSRGKLGECTSGTTTTPQTGSGGAIPASGLSMPTAASGNSLTVRDHADVTVTGVSDPGGTVSFSLCGPLALDSTSTCGTGGVAIGSAVALSGSSSPYTANSAVATLTSIGRYCWRAEYSGNAAKDVPPSSDSTASECFVVNPVAPALATDASDSVQLGNAISDTATLSGTARQPGTNGVGGAETLAPGSINATNAALDDGSITWRAFGPNNCTTVAMAATSRSVSGDGTYPTASQTAVSFTPTAVGQYTFVAKYDSGSINTNSVAESACPDLTDTEEVNVTDTSSVATHQKWLPNDSATITTAGGSPISGTLTMTLHESNDCSGTAVVGQTYTFDLANAASPATRSTSNATYLVEADKTVSWKSVFVSSNAGVASPASATCEVSTVDLTPNQ